MPWPTCFRSTVLPSGIRLRKRPLVALGSRRNCSSEACGPGHLDAGGPWTVRPYSIPCSYWITLEHATSWSLCCGPNVPLGNYRSVYALTITPTPCQQQLTTRPLTSRHKWHTCMHWSIIKMHHQIFSSGISNCWYIICHIQCQLMCKKVVCSDFNKCNVIEIIEIQFNS